MGLLDRLFGRTSKAADGPAPGVDLPYETVAVPGKKALAVCLDLRKQWAGQFTPVILGGPEEAARLAEGVGAEGFDPGAIIQEAEGISAESFFEKRLAEDPEAYNDVAEGTLPKKPAPAGDFTGHKDIMSGRPLAGVLICKVPATRSWEVPAYFNYGGWNACPFPAEHVAVWKHWHEQYGAEIITVKSDVIECTVARPPLYRDEALQLARRQFLYCDDIVYQGTETFAALAAALWEGSAWFFWWD